MNVLITGASGFIGKNLMLAIQETKAWTIQTINANSSLEEIELAVGNADAVIHLAGVNRPRETAEFQTGNVDFTRQLCEAIARLRSGLPLAFSSSIQAELDNPYGKSKLEAEQALISHAQATGCGLSIFRLPNVFGKWCRPHYNSVVATFCHNLINDLPIEVHDPDRILHLVYIDDVVAAFLDFLNSAPQQTQWAPVEPVHSISLGDLADLLRKFKTGRNSLEIADVGTGLIRALYATYVSYLKPEMFTYQIPGHVDERGMFVEMLKTPRSGQFSFFTAKPEVTRGGHYHHTKTEKFLVIKGQAVFRFRHVLTDERFQVQVDGDQPTVVETVPGWIHDVTNVGEEELIVMLWANEVFNPAIPDTFAAKIPSYEA